MKKNVDEIIKTKKQKILVVLTILLLLISTGLFSYAFSYDINYMGLNTNKIKTCGLDISFKENNPVRLLTTFPMSYNKALEYDPYTFSVISNGDTCDRISYQVTMEDACSTCTLVDGICTIEEGITCNCNNDYKLDPSHIAYELKNTRTGTILTGNDIGGLLQTNSLNSNITDSYEMRMWINEDSSMEDLYVYNNGVAVISDGINETKNYCGKLNVSVNATGSNDTNAPTCSISETPSGIYTSKTLTVTSSDTDLASNPYSWTNSTSNYSLTSTKTVYNNGIYRAWVKDNEGNVGTCSILIPTIKKNYLQPSTGSSDTTAFYAYRDQIKTITFQNTVNVPVNAVESWDVGYIHDGSIMAYIITNATDTTKYDLYIQGNGYINAPENSSYLFYNMKYVDAINNLSYLNTSNVTDMSRMFYNTGDNSTVFTLDLGDNFNTSNVTNMSYMFNNTGYISEVFTLNLGDNFNTSNVTNMSYMFNNTGYSSTVFTLDLGDNFNTSNVTNMSYMFNNTGYISEVFTLDLGDNFNTSNVTTMSNMFNYTGYSSTVFTTLYLNNSSFKSTVVLSNMINNNNITTVYVKTAADKTLLDAKGFTNKAGNTINVIVG